MEDELLASDLNRFEKQLAWKMAFKLGKKESLNHFLEKAGEMGLLPTNWEQGEKEYFVLRDSLPKDWAIIGEDDRFPSNFISMLNSDGWNLFCKTNSAHLLQSDQEKERMKNRISGVAAMILDKFLDEDSQESLPTVKDILKKEHGITPYCGSYANEIALSFGTAFLIRKDVVLTVAHNLYKEKDCSGSLSRQSNLSVFSFVFGYEKDDQGKLPSREQLQEKAFKGIEVLNYGHCSLSHMDWALVQLESSVPEEIGLPLPLTKRKSLKGLKRKEWLCAIGHPLGAHRTFTPNGQFFREYIENISFTTNLDTFSGNSGSPILNMRTGNVEGLLVKGAPDIRYGNTCFIDKVYTLEELSTGGAGEQSLDLAAISPQIHQTLSNTPLT